jgi:hypothetical protein
MLLETLLSFIAGVFIGGISTNAGKACLEYVWATDWYIKQTVRQHLKASEPIRLSAGYIIPYESLIDGIVSKLTSKEIFGIFVLAAPEGSGKSTFTKMTMEKLKAQHRSIYIKLISVGSDVLLEKNLHECLKIPPRRSLSDFLPELTLIFIDQIDFSMDFESSPLSEQLVLYLTGLAANSVNNLNFKIIICVSKPEVTLIFQNFYFNNILMYNCVLIMMNENISFSLGCIWYSKLQWLREIPFSLRPQIVNLVRQSTR